ncbi:MAG: DUF4280 domain-containing protein [Methanomicrobiaceae archaeon]|nr:DUF4280 domain-containing protein [Methanomicrobiaceae archaeon]
MAMLVVMGATLRCSFGNAPSNLIVLPVNKVMVGNMPVANIMDNKPMVNILPFGMCSSMSNPTVAAATAAAMGVLTPMPCIPLTTAPWSPGSATVTCGNMPALNNTSKCMCNWGGSIEITHPGQQNVETP